LTILPWVKVPHLASHLLGLMARRISPDWEEIYQHEVVWLETFVDPERGFEGTCYRAANWIYLGQTTGRGNNDQTHRVLRDVEKLEKDFPDSPEIKSFVSILASLLSQAMQLRSQPLSDEQYYRQAEEIKKKIMEVNKGPAQHLAIRAMQDLFKTNEHRLYHWVQDRRVPPDNNLAERDLRPTVIARKVSFGSSSHAGSKTRSILMSVLHSQNKRRGDQSLESIFKNLLDELPKNPKVQIASFFPQSKSPPLN
jgi:hypothetical protein